MRKSESSGARTHWIFIASIAARMSAASIAISNAAHTRIAIDAPSEQQSIAQASAALKTRQRKNNSSAK